MATMRETRIWFWVKVPVLSKMMSVTRANLSMVWPRVTSSPMADRCPVAAVKADGVASASAHGQVTTSTAIAWRNHASPPAGSHARTVMPVRINTASEKWLAMRSANCAAAGFSPSARPVRRTICASTVSAPTLVICTNNGDPALTAPPTTASPTRFCTGTLSPVITASLTSPAPSTILPSAGMIEPLSTNTTSFGCSDTEATVSVSREAGKPRTRSAVAGGEWPRRSMISTARARDSASR